MADINTSRLIANLTFTTQGGKSTVRIPDVKANITESEIEDVMDAIVSTNCFGSSTGNLIGKAKFTVVDTSTDGYDLVIE